jgi:hypothetical protein
MILPAILSLAVISLMLLGFWAPGQFGRGHPRYGGYGRPAGYHGD